MVLYGRLMELEIDKIEPIEINQNISRKPKFGFGSMDELRRVVEIYGDEHSPLVWLIKRRPTPTGIDGLYQVEVELNICVEETRTELLNTQRVDPYHSYETVLLPLWKKIFRQLEVSGSIDIVEDSIKAPIDEPNYKFDGEHETQRIWDVLKVIFTIQFNKEYTPCCQ